MLVKRNVSFIASCSNGHKIQLYAPVPDTKRAYL